MGCAYVAPGMVLLAGLPPRGSCPVVVSGEAGGEYRARTMGRVRGRAVSSIFKSFGSCSGVRSDLVPFWPASAAPCLFLLHHTFFSPLSPSRFALSHCPFPLPCFLLPSPCTPISLHPRTTLPYPSLPVPPNLLPPLVSSPLHHILLFSFAHSSLPHAPFPLS